MPVYAADLLPDTTGRNLGNPSQRWNGYAQSLDILGNVSYQPVAGAIMRPSGAIYVSTAPVTANANTTAVQGLCNFVVPAFLLNQVGKVFRGTMAGTVSTQAGQTPGFGIGASFGSLNVFGVNSPALPSSTAGLVWRAQWEFSVRTAGTSGVIDPHGTLAYQSTSGNIAILLISPASSMATNPIDLTIAQVLNCYGGFGTNSSPANTLVQQELILEVLN